MAEPALVLGLEEGMPMTEVSGNPHIVGGVPGRAPVEGRPGDTLEGPELLDPVPSSFWCTVAGFTNFR